MKVWKPFPRQEKALERPEFEVLVGGARGPGKTEAGIVWLIGEPHEGEYDFYKTYLNNPEYRALVIRKNADDLRDWVDRCLNLHRGFKPDAAYHPTIIRYPSGAKIYTGHLGDKNAYTKYQGQEYPRILVEELTQIAEEKLYLQLIGSCRSTKKGLKPQVFLTTNPGNLGHYWVKQHFVDPSPPDTPFISKQTGRSCIFIPSTLDDNPVLKEKDPNYVKQMDALKYTDRELWKAWRLGDWNTFAGQYFREFRVDLHTTDYFVPSKELTKFAGSDWGFSPRPFVFLTSALQKVRYIDDDDYEYQFNRLWVYDEITGTETPPHEWAEKLNSKFNWDEFKTPRADPSMFHKTQDGSRSIADQFMEKGVALQPANNDRIGGWTVLRNWFSIAPDGLPYLIISKKCHNLITHLPTLVHDENKIGDLDTHGLDDEADALRYMCVHIPWIDARAGAVKRGVDKKARYLHDPNRTDLDAWSKARR